MSAKPKTIVVKVGTSTLTDADGCLDREYISDLARQLCALQEDGRRVVLVTSGAIRAGCERLGWTQRPTTVPLKQAAAAVGQGRLMETYSFLFAEHNRAVGQVLLTRGDCADRTRYVNARNTLNTLLRCGVLPIVNENDTVAVDEIRFGDNDTLSALVAAIVHADALVLLTNVEGLLDPEGNVLSQVRDIGAVRALAGGASGAGSGGMVTKLDAAEIAAAAGIRTVICRGRPADVLLRIAAGEPVGTVFQPWPRRLQGRKHWIAFGPRPRGTLVVNPCAHRAVTREHRSLLPAGIVGVEGRFGAGDIVSLVTEEGLEFARGLIGCDSRECEALMGKHSSLIQQLVGRADLQEVIHRDNLVVLE